MTKGDIRYFHVTRRIYLCRNLSLCAPGLKFLLPNSTKNTSVINDCAPEYFSSFKSSGIKLFTNFYVACTLNGVPYLGSNLKMHIFVSLTL